MRRAGMILLAVFIGLSFTGCFNYRELKDFTIVMGIGIDASKSGYQVTAEIALPDEAESRSVSEPIKPRILSAEGGTVAEGLKNMAADNNLYFNHCRIAVLSEQVAKGGVEDIADFFLRSADFQKNMIVAVTPGRADKLFEAEPETLSILSEELARSIVSAEDMRSKTTSSNVYGMFNKLKSDMVLPRVVTTKEGEKVSADADGIAFLKNGAYTGSLGGKDCLYYLLSESKAKKGIVSLGGYDAAEIVSSHAKNKDGKLSVSVELSVLGSGTLELSDEKKKEILKKADESFKENILRVNQMVSRRFGFTDKAFVSVECQSKIRDGRLSR